jgi:actin-related protein 6
VWTTADAELAQSLNAYNDLHPLFEGEAAKRVSRTFDPPMECLLVIDSGYSQTVVTPILKGRPVQRAIRRQDLGGKHLTNLLKEIVSIRHFDLHQDTKIVSDIKEDVCFVSQNFAQDMEQAWKGVKKARGTTTASNDKEGEIRVDYVLPDGLHLTRGFSRPHDPSAAAARKRKANALAADSEVAMMLGNERFTIPEIIFNPSDLGSKQPGLADMVIQSMAVLPPLIQATMLSNVLVVGGNAKLPGFAERTEAELRMKVKTDWAVRVRRMEDPIRSSWLGGARMAASHKDVVREYGVTREEYFEHGSGWMARKFLSGNA